jgi:hypothetical protein
MCWNSGASNPQHSSNYTTGKESMMRIFPILKQNTQLLSKLFVRTPFLNKASLVGSLSIDFQSIYIYLQLILDMIEKIYIYHTLSHFFLLSTD